MFPSRSPPDEARIAKIVPADPVTLPRAPDRMILGLKNIPHDLAFLSNDDVETPTSMVGKKMVPILELGRRGSDDHEVCALGGGVRGG